MCIYQSVTSIVSRPQIFKSLLTIKLNSWEVKFQAKVLDSRGIELTLLWTLLMLFAVNIFLLWMAPNIVAVATIAVYTKVNFVKLFCYCQCQMSND
jgi:hypothetical protein